MRLRMAGGSEGKLKINSIDGRMSRAWEMGEGQVSGESRSTEKYRRCPVQGEQNTTKQKSNDRGAEWVGSRVFVRVLVESEQEQRLFVDGWMGDNHKKEETLEHWMWKK
mmetsp:Transcript_81324/g.170013  ORF Transcript_81324/g.170013 Transcript_81324/m.170013 type:complete len:109 (+) Transcript_81324:134-460(+)